ncbi:hypothetical protein BDZ85DRAFT_95365 [Elsinoe ampelina]|uniref:Uncharacterized protein n=1 Tax=Elsinoe ampelina TaxID=302913 RepID=A0A6A6GE72_9PEZI|nr:hypothetical protein BDZ85DRAFT_95365 [Elsinoe ampelina]
MRKFKNLFSPRARENDISGNTNPVTSRQSSEGNRGSVLILPALVDPNDPKGYHVIRKTPRDVLDTDTAKVRKQSSARRSVILEDLHRIDRSVLNRDVIRPNCHSIDVGSYIRENAKDSHERQTKSSDPGRKTSSSGTRHGAPEGPAVTHREKRQARSSPTLVRAAETEPEVCHGDDKSVHTILRKPVAGESPKESPQVPAVQRFEDQSVTGAQAAIIEPPGIEIKPHELDLTNTVDTSIHETWAPAVTHEKVNQHVEHVRQEHIQREIHTHDIFHRVLPIMDVEVLPARHFYPSPDGNLVEFNHPTTPSTQKNIDRLIKDAFSGQTSSSTPLKGRRPFTARTFTGSEGDYRAYQDENGVSHQQTTWVHPPQLDQGAWLAKQTEDLVIS